MRLFHRPQRRKGRRGFTLTEMALVLGVIGTVLGAVWVASIRVNNANKVQKATAETQQIVTNYRSLYSMHGVDVADWTDITCIGVTNGYFPTDMVATGATCTASVSGTGTYTGTTVTTPWGGSSYAEVWAYQTDPGIIVGYFNLSQIACNNLAISIAASADVIWQNINGTAQFLPPYAATTLYSPTTINGLCGAGNGNYLYVMYTVK